MTEREYPELDPKKFTGEELLQRFQKVQSFCLQAGTCTDVGKGNPGLDCAQKDGKMDRRCVVHDCNLDCPLKINEEAQERLLKKIEEKLNPWWVNLSHRLFS